MTSPTESKPDFLSDLATADPCAVADHAQAGGVDWHDGADPTPRRRGRLSSLLADALARAERSVAERDWVEHAGAEIAEAPAAAAAKPRRPRARPAMVAAPREQLVLAVSASPNDGLNVDRVIATPSNAAAIRVASAPETWPNGFACLVGPRASGKTHLTWALHADAVRLDATDCVDGFVRPEVVTAGRMLVFDDMDRAFLDVEGGGFDIAAFHLLNMVHQRGARLLATGVEAPARWAAVLPDLRSRLAASPLAGIEAPDDAMLADLLAKHFEDRGLRVEHGVVAYLVKRMERSHAAALEIVERLDHASLREKRSITTPLAAAALGWRPTRF